MSRILIFALFALGAAAALGLALAGGMGEALGRAADVEWDEEEEADLIREIEDFYNGFDNDYLGEWSN